MRRRLLVAEGATTAGGDWFDAYALPSGRQVLLVGDVVGHGARAAGQSAIFRHSLRTLLLTGSDPATSLVQLEQLVVPHPDRPRGTLLLTVVDPTERRAVLYTAAHPPPVLVTPDGHAGPIAVEPVPPLGSGLIAVEPRPAIVDLSPGSMLVMITDGVIEQRGVPIDRGYEQLCATLRGSSTVDDVMARVDAWIGRRELRDDALFVAVAID